MYNIGLNIKFTDNFDRHVVKGILSFAKEKNWNLYAKGLWFSDLSKAKLDGIIARIETQEDEELCLSYHVPIVDIAGASNNKDLNIVKNNDLETGKVCGEYFLKSGVENYAAILVSNTIWARERYLGFIKAIGKQAIPVFQSPLNTWYDTYGEMEKLDKFLLSLKKPTSLFCVNDLTAMKVAETCLKNNIKIPEELMILSVDNEELMCMLAKPSLSSISLNLQRIGYEAASRVEEILTNNDTKATIKLIPPSTLVERESTMFVLTSDPFVSKAVMNIRKKATFGLTCGELIADIPISRRSLEERFYKIRGKTLLEEVTEVRLNKAETLLRDTNIKLEGIWKSCGFGSAQRFFYLVKNKYGYTPKALRKILNSSKEN